MTNRKQLFSYRKLSVGLTFLLGVILAAALAYGTSSARPGNRQQLDEQQRTYRLVEKTVPKEAIKIVEVKNLNSPNFPLDFGVVIENVSDQPIYGINVSFYSEIRGRRTGFSMYYGRPAFVSLSTLATEEDKPIAPGEKYTLTPVQAVARGLQEYSKQLAPSEMNGAWQINFQVISFGNGDGYVVGVKKLPPAPKP